MLYKFENKVSAAAFALIKVLIREWYVLRQHLVIVDGILLEERFVISLVDRPKDVLESTIVLRDRILG